MARLIGCKLEWKRAGAWAAGAWAAPAAQGPHCGPRGGIGGMADRRAKSKGAAAQLRLRDALAALRKATRTGDKYVIKDARADVRFWQHASTMQRSVAVADNAVRATEQEMKGLARRGVCRPETLIPDVPWGMATCKVLSMPESHVRTKPQRRAPRPGTIAEPNPTLAPLPSIAGVQKRERRRADRGRAPPPDAPVCSPAVEAVFAELEARKANLPALLRSQEERADRMLSCKGE